MAELNKVGRYGNVAEPFHCDFKGRLFWGHMGNHLLNAADFHSTERGFGIRYLNSIRKTWVLSRLVIEMDRMPEQYDRFSVSTWVESALRFFTNRNFKVVADNGEVLGNGRSVWVMIDTETRQPVNLADIDDGSLEKWIDPTPSSIAPPARVRMSKEVPLREEHCVRYNDVDINGHLNSVKYIEHVMDLYSLDFYREHPLHRLDVAYVAEAHEGDTLRFYVEQEGEYIHNVRIAKQTPEGEIECCKVQLTFQ